MLFLDGYVARCSQSTVAETSRASRPVTYEEAKEKIKMGRRFGLEGLSSGVDIRQLWPSVEVCFTFCNLVLLVIVFLGNSRNQ